MGEAKKKQKHHRKKRRTDGQAWNEEMQLREKGRIENQGRNRKPTVERERNKVRESGSKKSSTRQNKEKNKKQKRDRAKENKRTNN